MAELIAFKNQVKELLKSNDRCDIDPSKILKVHDDLTTSDVDTMEDITPTAQDVYDKLIEMFPEKKCFNDRKKR